MRFSCFLSLLLLTTFQAISQIPAIAPDTVRHSSDSVAVYAVSFSHGDLGYGNYPHVLRTDNRLENLFRAIHYCEITDRWPVGSRYCWQQEMAEPLPYFLSNCSDVQRKALARYILEKRISIAATHSTVLADRLNPESASRLFYLGCRYLPDLLGTSPGQVAIINDVTGLPWSFPIYCEAAQVPFVWNGHNECARMDELESAPLVRWRGPAGTGSVLAFSNVYNFHGLRHPKTELPGAFERDAKLVTPDFVPVWLQGDDLATATLDTDSLIRQWNQTGSPIIRMATLDDYLNQLARRQSAEKIPSVSKTGPCQWIDQPLTDAWLFGRVRLAGERLPMAEKFSALALTTTPGGYPWLDFTIGWHNLLSNLEHTVGAACWATADTKGWCHYETEQTEHREEGLEAVARSENTLQQAIARLTRQIRAHHPNTLAVFNALGQPRTDVVTFYDPRFAGNDIVAIDDATGQPTPCQRIGPDTLMFIATDVPAMGYRTYHLEKQALRSLPNPEHDCYRLAIDPATGSITSLFDNELHIELVHNNGPHRFNQYLYEWFANPSGGPSWSRQPTDISVTTENGPVASVYHIRSHAEGVEWLDQMIIQYHAIKRIDFAIRMNKKPSGRTLADYLDNNSRGKEAVFIALPFDVPGFKAVYESAGGGVAEPIVDQFNGTGTAFYAVQHFADLSNDRFGVTVSPIDCSLVEFGYPRADELSRKRPESEAGFEKTMTYPENSSLYLYLLDNMFTTNIRVDQPGEQYFRWAIRSHAGNWQAGEADIFGEAVHQPLIAGWVHAHQPTLPDGAHSFASTDADNIAISTCKPAEWNGDGFIVRLVETRGIPTTTLLHVPFLAPLSTARMTTLTETDLDEWLPTTDSTIRISIPAYGIKTIRIQHVGNKIGKVGSVSAKPVADREIALDWEPVAGAAFYRVYRSTTPDFQPALIHLVAMPATNQYLDQTQDHLNSWVASKLAPETQYYYRVEAVDAFNIRGPVSECVGIKTLATAQKSCAPERVQDLHAILISPLAPAHQVNLLWRSNIDPNLSGYEIYRSTTAGFTPSPETLLSVVNPYSSNKATIYKGLDHQMFLDEKTASGLTYYYQIRARASTGQTGAFSNEASVSIPIKQ